MFSMHKFAICSNYAFQDAYESKGKSINSCNNEYIKVKEIDYGKCSLYALKTKTKDCNAMV